MAVDRRARTGSAGVRRRSRVALTVGLAALPLLLLSLAPPAPAVAETGKKALVLEDSVSGGASSFEAQRATALGFAVTVVDAATWSALTAAQFSDYQLLIVGDPTCSSLSPAVSENAVALADAVMARTGQNSQAGNRVLIGTDPAFHYSQGGKALIDTGIDFAGAQEGRTGLYLNFSCNDPDYDGNGTPDGQGRLLPLLTIATPNWTQNTSPPCGGSASLIANAAQFSTLRSADLQGWGCSVHETFPTYPTDWSPLAIATDTDSKPTCGTDVDDGTAQCGESHVLIAGSGIVAEAPNLSLDPKTATNPVGTTHTVTATVTNPNGTPRPGTAVSFVVTGANAGAAGTCAPASCVTGSSGTTTFTYTGTQAGDDTINASITVDGSTQNASAAKTWVPVTRDTTRPTCSIERPTSGKAVITWQDAQSGLASIVTARVSGLSLVTDAFSPGTTGPVKVTATRTNPAKVGSVQIYAVDVAGNRGTCDSTGYVRV